MDTLLLIILIVFGLAILGKSFGARPSQQVIYVPVVSEPTPGSFGCLPLIIVFVVLVVLAGAIKF
jgi:hypothetical protein